MCAGTGKRTRQPPPPVVTADPTPGPKPCLGQAHFSSGQSWRDGRTLPAQLLSQPFGPAPRENRSTCDIYHRQAPLNVVSPPLSREIASFETGRFEHEFNLAPPIPIEGRQKQDAASVCDGQLSGDDGSLTWRCRSAWAAKVRC